MKKAILFLLAATIYFSCGKDNNTPENLGIKIGGQIKCASGSGLQGVSVSLLKSDGTSETAQTDVNGVFLFQNQAKDLAYQIVPSLAGNFYDAVDQADADLLDAFNIGTKSPSVWEFLACPLATSTSSTLGKFDLATMKKLVKKEPTGGISAPKWQFYAPDATILNDQATGNVNVAKLGVLTFDKLDANLVGVKFCDVNGSYCP